MTKPVSILVGALGGQGGGVLAEWLVESATQAGYVAQSTSIPGVAQRTGATTYYVEVYPEPAATLGERRPILGLYPTPGQVDVVVASELLEAGRLLQAGFVTPQTTLITSTSRTLTTAEKIALGDGRFSSERLLDTARQHACRLCAFDMDVLARDAGTVVSSVMLGAIAGSRALPMPRTAYEEVVRAAGVGVEGSLRGFARGFAAVAEGASSAVASPLHGPAGPAIEEPTSATKSSHAIADAFPPAAREIIALGHARVVEFQDARYGELYLERLRRIDAAEHVSAGSDPRDGRVLRETARFLALWMAFDDIVRVAGLKSRAARFARVRQELGAGARDVVRIIDHFKPGVPEFAGLLPSPLATILVRWDRRRQSRGRAPLAWPLHLRTHAISGLLLLRGLATLRRLRRLGARYGDEQRGIERWLTAIERCTRDDLALGYEVALCGRLIKGYGVTNERGKANLAHILEHVAERHAPVDARIAAIRAAREAALADEGGKALDAELVRQGAPVRPVIAQPIRFMPRRDDGAQHARAH
jgi:indolepyruvate ferredoxin oxidoreductase beta subunit